MMASSRTALALRVDAALPAAKSWFFGGRGDFFRGLTWTQRPADMARSGAPASVQDAWVATVMALQEEHGALRNGTCYYLNLAGAPLLQKVLGEPVQLCAGYACFFERTGKIETGFRYRPSKWGAWIDADAGKHVGPLGDVHCWLETESHLIDFDGGAGDPADVWPPLIYRPKSALPKHPREVYGPGAILLWRSSAARDLVGTELVPKILSIAMRAVEIYDTFVNGTHREREKALARHESVMRVARAVAQSFLANSAQIRTLR